MWVKPYWLVRPYPTNYIVTGGEFILDKLTKDKQIELLTELKAINEYCGIDQSDEKIQSLDIQKQELQSEIQQYNNKLSNLNSKLLEVNKKLLHVSGYGIEVLLKAIKGKSYYSLSSGENRYIMHRETGLLLYYFADNIMSNKIIDYLEQNKFRIPEGFDIPDDGTVKYFYNDSLLNNDGHIKIADWCFPIAVRKNNNEKKITGYISCNPPRVIWFDGQQYDFARIVLFRKFDDLDVVSSDNLLCTEQEKDVIVLNKIVELYKIYGYKPNFEIKEANDVFYKMFERKPAIEKLLLEYGDTNITLPEENINISIATRCNRFNFEEILSNYDVKAINNSYIKYYQAIQQWIEELLEKLDYYESEKEAVIRDFNVIGLKLAKRYENSEHLTEEENALLRDRQRYFACLFSLGMNSIKSKLLSVKHQADELEYRIDEIDNGDDAIHQLALLEKEERASFGFIAENTAKIIRNALKKIEFFEDNHQYVVWAVHAWEEWTESYRVFKTTYLEDLKGTCEEDGIEEEIWQKWYSDWQSLRFSIEEKVHPIIEKELRERIAMVEEGEISVAQKIIAELEVYRDAVDTFYHEERKGIYQNFAFQSNGDVQDKLETESKLYKLTAQFQSALQSIIFNCAKAEDRIYILNWAKSLLDIQIDDILSLVADNDLQQISDTILTEFSELKQKKYEIYLADAKSYGEEQARRDKQFNSLVFKMRKGLK